MLAMIGVLGGYTTFSTFGYETLVLARQGSFALAALNAGGQATVEKATVIFYRAGDTPKG